MSHCFNRKHNTVEIALSKDLGDLNSSLALPLIFQDGHRQVTYLLSFVK